MAVIPPDAGIRMRMQTEASLVQPLAPVKGIPADLPDLQIGQTFTARVVETLPENTFKALVAGKQLTLQLPEGAEPGDTLELVVIDRTPRTLIAQRTEPQAKAAEAGQPYPYARLSDAGRLIGQLVLPEGESPQPAPLNRGQPLLPQPPAGADELVPTLARAVSQSGLFYESHQAQWLAGQRPLESLRAEPQGRLPAPSHPVTGQPAAAGSAQQPLPAAATPEPSPLSGQPPEAADSRMPAPPQPAAAPQPGPAPTRLPVMTMPEPSAPGPSPLSGQPPETGGSLTYHLQRQSVGNESRLMIVMDVETSRSPEPASGNSIAQPATAAHDRPAMAAPPSGVERAAATAATAGQAIPDEIRPIVQQQLDAVATQRLAWHGEVWPDQPMDWTIEREDVEDRDAGPASGDAPRWSTRLRLTMPRLGTVDATLQLAGNGLHLRMMAATEDSVGDLRRQAPVLAQALAGAGLAVQSLEVRLEA